jgi:urea transporter
VVFAIIAAVVTVAWSKWIPVPFLAAPFILSFWAAWLLAEHLGITKVAFDPFPEAPVVLGPSVLMALGSALFIPSILSAAIFVVGIAVSSWRHALIAAFGAFIANALALRGHAVGGAINFGFMGFNGVLAAIAAYVIVAADLRFVLLGSLLATWLASYVYRDLVAVPVLASGFVLAIWVMLFLDWLNPRFAAKAPEPKTAPEPKSASEPKTAPA